MPKVTLRPTILSDLPYVASEPLPYRIRAITALVGYLGRVDPEKNVDILVRAFQDVDAPEDVKLVVVGSGSEKRRLDRRFRRAHRARAAAAEVA